MHILDTLSPFLTIQLQERVKPSNSCYVDIFAIKMSQQNFGRYYESGHLKEDMIENGEQVILSSQIKLQDYQLFLSNQFPEEVNNNFVKKITKIRQKYINLFDFNQMFFDLQTLVIGLNVPKINIYLDRSYQFLHFQRGYLPYIDINMGPGSVKWLIIDKQTAFKSKQIKSFLKKGQKFILRQQFLVQNDIKYTVVIQHPGKIVIIGSQTLFSNESFLQSVHFSWNVWPNHPIFLQKIIHFQQKHIKHWRDPVGYPFKLLLLYLMQKDHINNPIQLMKIQSYLSKQLQKQYVAISQNFDKVMKLQEFQEEETIYKNNTLCTFCGFQLCLFKTFFHANTAKAQLICGMCCINRKITIFSLSRIKRSQKIQKNIQDMVRIMVKYNQLPTFFYKFNFKQQQQTSSQKFKVQQQIINDNQNQNQQRSDYIDQINMKAKQNKKEDIYNQKQVYFQQSDKNNKNKQSQDSDDSSSSSSYYGQSRSGSLSNCQAQQKIRKGNNKPILKGNSLLIQFLIFLQQFLDFPHPPSKQHTIQRKAIQSLFDFYQIQYQKRYKHLIFLVKSKQSNQSLGQKLHTLIRKKGRLDLNIKQSAKGHYWFGVTLNASIAYIREKIVSKSTIMIKPSNITYITRQKVGNFG